MTCRHWRTTLESWRFEGTERVQKRHCRIRGFQLPDIRVKVLFITG